VIQLEVKRLSSPDVEVDRWEPKAKDDVYFVLELEIGIVGDRRADLFHVIVATPEGLRRFATTEVISERSTLVLADFSWPLTHKTIKNIVQRCESPGWAESLVKLQRYFHWEYEDYSVLPS
jgi:hypothetical protein